MAYSAAATGLPGIEAELGWTAAVLRYLEIVRNRRPTVLVSFRGSSPSFRD
ncbi:MAG: hypothetical protein IT293_09660 [Deltaproteobacteria bacterium]|nr:hypothetical protein [Deltaproteobacteria bacterium]